MATLGDPSDPEAGPLEPPVIARRGLAARRENPVDFHALRRAAIERAQAASGRRWTDYNLHDPGVTILEQVCYALTELAYRADFPVADHLCGLDGQVAYERQGLFRPQDILPCRATTQADYRRLLIDKVAELADARFAAPDAQAPGLHRLRLRFAYNRDGDDPVAIARRIQDAKAAYRASRGFAEDLDDDVGLIAARLCDLRLDASITGMRDPEDLAADIYWRCAIFIAGLPRPKSYDELVRAGRPYDEVLDGPRTRHGVIESAELDATGRGRLVLSDLRAQLLQIDGVSDVSRLELKFEDGAVVTRVLEWSAEAWAPRLRIPGAGADISLLRLSRREMVEPLDPQAVARRFADSGRPMLAGFMSASDGFEEVAPPPRGVFRPPGGYESVQNQFPAIYGLGRRNAMEAGAQAGGRVAQLTAYLALFDEMLANGAAKLAHVRDLFTPEGTGATGGRRDVLGDAEVSGIEALWAAPRDVVRERAYAEFDRDDDRLSRVLDYLLSLYGEIFAQNTSRQFLDFLDSRELGRTLLELKRAYLKDIVVLGRDRAAGFDYGLDLWKTPSATSGLQQRIALLLGFRTWRARPLTRLFAARRRAAAAGRSRALPPAPTRDVAADEALSPLAWPIAPERSRRGDAAALRRLRQERSLHAALLIHGVNRQRYGWRPNPRGKGGRLLLGPDRSGDPNGVADGSERWWDLGAFADEAAAARIADKLRRRILRLNAASEGFHMVEHILLRPRTPGATGFDPAFHPLRATFVFPGWTARTCRGPFRHFADETVQINCPAHVAARCLWLDFPQMQQFERLQGAWLNALRLWTVRGERLDRVDAAAAALADFLRPRLAAAAPGAR